MKSWQLICGCAVAFVLASLGGAQAVGPILRPAPELHREQPDDPPSPRPAPHPRRHTTGITPSVGGPYVSVQVNVDELGNNIPGDAANEPSLAIDPTDPAIIVIGWRQFDSVLSNFRQAGYGYSHDGGATWTFPGVLDPGIFRSDPVLDSDADGNIYYYSLRSDFFCDIFKSANGVAWLGPLEALGGDKAWLTIDKTGSVGQGNLYTAWSTAGNNYFPNQFARSTDSGVSWPDLVEIPPVRPTWGTLAVDPEGDLYVSGQSGGDVFVAKSTDAKLVGQTPSFDFTIQVDLGGTFFFGGDPNPGGLVGQVWVAADNSGGATNGNIYLLSSMNPPGQDPLDVKFARSEDGGLTWSDPVRINDDELLADAWQWFGTMSVAPTGRIDVVWNDTRSSGTANLSELYYAYSTDAGQTWSANIPISPTFNSHVGWPQQNKLGDYYDMISDEAAANLAYAATFNLEQDVYFVRIGDCNENGVHDGQDIDSGGSLDVDGSGIPDDCECLSDFDDNGVTDASDLALLLGAWGPNPGHPADLNGDGSVDAADLALLLGNWGLCP